MTQTIVTKEMLADTFVGDILANIQEDRNTSIEPCDTMDDYLWKNLKELGFVVYELIGEYYGCADSALEACNE